jgi:hypothetical protein
MMVMMMIITIIIYSHSINLCLHKSLDIEMVQIRYRVILLVLDPRKCEYLKDYSSDSEHAYVTTYLAS